MIYGDKNIIGAKGTGGKTGSDDSSSPVEDPDTLSSKSTARFVDLLSEGPILGLADGDKSIFLNETPLQNDDGTYNFEGVSYSTRLGDPSQDYIPGYPSVESEINVSTQIKKSISISRTITNVNANALRVKIRVPRLSHLESESGDLHGSEVEIAIDLKTDTGSFIEQTIMTISGKSSSPYERSVRLELPVGGNPWTLRARRLTDDSTESTLSNDTYLSSYTEVIDAKLSYPDSALIGMAIDAETFGTYVPTRAYDIYGIISSVPSNYDPETRVYTGLWDGTFQQAWHDNPAWVLWDLMTNARYGLGDVIPEGSVDKFGLYSISQYCDELVPDGYGGQEPRFTFNGVINSREEAAKVLDAVASAFRGMIYWGAGAVTMVQDSPASAVKLVAPANVIEGEFSYTGSALKARYSVVVVGWNDPNDLSRITFEVVRRDDLIQKYGIREKEVNAFGCTSRGQAQRFGEWILDTEENETEVVTYRAALDHADVRPGQIIAVADPSYAGARFGGRIVSATTTVIEIDSGIDIEVGETYQLSVVLADGSIETQDISTGVGSDITTVTVSSAFTSAPESNAMWVVAASNAEPRKFRVISNRETSKNIYEIMALFHDGTKYDRVDRGVDLEDPEYSIFPTGVLRVPTTLSLEEFFKVHGNSVSAAVTLSWAIADDPRVQTYEVHVQGVNDATWRPLNEHTSISRDDYPVVEGEYKFRVRSKAPLLQPSQWVEYTTSIMGLNQTIGDVQNFMISTNGQTSILSWDKLTELYLDHYDIRYSALTSGATWDISTSLISGVSKDSTSVVVPSRVGTYLIKAVSVSGRYSDSASLVTSSIAAAENINIVETISEHPAWAGTHDDTRSDTTLTLDFDGSTVMSDWNPLELALPLGGAFELDGTYTFANSLDLGGVYRFSVAIELDAVLLEWGGFMESWGTLDNLTAMSSVGVGNWAVGVEYRSTEDDPGGSPTWSSWADFVTGFYQTRAMEFRLNLTSNDPSVSPEVISVTVTADMEDRVAGIEDVNCPANGLTVTFAQPFKATPTVHIDGQGLVTGDYHRVTLKTASGFNVEFFDTGASSISRTFDWLAKGYGYEQ